MTKYIAFFCAAVMAISTGTAIVFADETDTAGVQEEITETVEVGGEADTAKDAAQDNTDENTAPVIPEAEENGTKDEAPSESDKDGSEAVDGTVTEAPAPTETVDNTATEAPAATEAVDNTATETPSATEAAEATATAVPEQKETAEPEVKATQAPTEKPDVVKIEKTGINPFDDCQNAWFTDYVTFAYENGLIKGIDNTHFNPYGDITRAQLAVILYRIHSDKLDIVTEGDTWADEAEKWALDRGIMADFMGADFDGSTALTREEVVSAIFRAYQIANETGERSKSELLMDWDKVSDYAVDAMQWSVAVGIIKGKGDKWIAPQNHVTRAEMATMLQRYLTNLTFEKVVDEATEVLTEEAAEETVPGADATEETVDNAPEIAAEPAAATEAAAEAEKAAEESVESEPEAAAEEAVEAEAPAEDAAE